MSPKASSVATKLARRSCGSRYVWRAAGPVGRDLQAGTDLQMRAEILSYSRARGLFAGVTVNGSTVRTDADAIYRFYDTRFSSTQIVVGGLAGSPGSTQEWQGTLAKYAPPR